MSGSVPRKNGRVNSGKIITNACHDWSKALIDGPQDIGFDSSYVTGGDIQNPPYAFFCDGILDRNSHKAVLLGLSEFKR